ncbi:MAG TPA: methyltransferase [Actinotalea sp.]
MVTDAPVTDAPVTDGRLLDALRSDLGAAHFVVDALEGVLGSVAAAALNREQVVPALRATQGSTDPVATLLRLFILGAPVERGALDRALPRVGTGGAERLALVEAGGSAADDRVRPLVDLRPYAAVDGAGEVEWWLASDLGEVATGAPLRQDHVLGVGGASTTLAQVTIRSPRRRALDLGTGCGVQALHAARHTTSVVATDTSARALAFARFNATLAGIDLDLRRGSMFDPVRQAAGGHDYLFDLIVSNPPFVITPRGGSGGTGGTGGTAGTGGAAVPVYEYRDGGRAGDDLVRDLILEVGTFLEPGGVAQLLGNWEHRRGEGWVDRVGAWLDASALDGWVVQREVLDPAEYAEMWLRDGGTTPARDLVGWAARYGAWLDDFASRDVEAVGLGMVVLRRPVQGEASLRRVEDRGAPVHQPLGPYLEAGLRAHDWLREQGARGLGDARLQVAADVTEERHLVPGAEDPSVVLLRQGGGFGRVVQAGTALAGLVGACDGELSVAQVIGALATLLEVPAEALRDELLPQVADLVRDGFLVAG